uniref:Uncharacterized protein n=1 Tax=Tanacetum cinerariifolium TaxID=118510 RepID=A0A699JCP0_TANCI|nr:hypothetical protein [Tanacetum cinerariifolium]
MIDQLEKLKDDPMELIMASLYFESDTAPQWIRDLRPSSSQLKILVYPEAEKKKKCRVVYRTHGVGFTHHAKSDYILVFASTVLQGLAILLADAATQTEATDQDELHPRL